MEDMLLTVTEISQILKTNKDYVYDLIKKGFLPALKLGTLKVRTSSLTKFLKDYEGMDLTNLDEVKALQMVG